MELKRSARRLVVVLAVAGAGSVVAQAATVDPTVSYQAASGLKTRGLRPTAVGLPQLGAAGTVGAAELPSVLRTYHDSGRYQADLEAVDGAARTELARRIATGPVTTTKCGIGYVRVKGKRKLYRRKRVCRTKTTSYAPKGKPAIVLDIDETSLSNYAGIQGAGFAAAGSAGPIASGTGTAIAPTLALFKYARAHKVAVFFVTGRPEALRAVTERNLRAAGYDDWTGLELKPAGTTTEAYKSGARKAIQKRGYDILVNVGDQESDLDGGHADRAFKLPNPFYFIAD